MKQLNYYKNKLNTIDKKEIFEHLLSTMLRNNHTWSYFMDWDKVESKSLEYDNEAKRLNKLLNAKDIDKEFELILKNAPDTFKVFPALLATREKKINVLGDDVNFKYTEFDFKNIDQQKVDEYKDFFRNSGLRELFSNKSITCVRSYLKGIEAGLNSNARKNRSGEIMESMVHKILKKICSKFNITCITQCNENSKALKDNDIVLPVDKTSRSYDFALITKKKKLILIETNFYSGGGSKLKATCGEYKSLQNFLRAKNVTFVWITDGYGWLTTKLGLQEAFENNDYILNLSMSRDGALKEILKP